MAKRTVVTRDELELPDNIPPDPVAVALKTFLVEGGPVPDGLGSLEFRVRFQQLDKRGRVVHGIAHESGNLATMFDEVLDELGPGRYNIWCNYRPAGSSDKTEWKLIKVADATITDEPVGNTPPAQVPALASGGVERGDLMTLLITLMQQNTQIIAAALSSRNNNSNATRDVLEAIRVGAELKGGGEDNAPRDEDPVERLIRFGGDVLDFLRNNPGEESAVRKIAEKNGIDEAAIKQGLEIVKEAE